MSDDGADMGITADRALKTVLGGEPSPIREDGMTPGEMRAYLESAPSEADSYDDGARATGKVILAYLDKHPEDADLPAESVLDFEGEKKRNPAYDWSYVPPMLQPGLSDAIKQKEPAMWEMVPDGITGFMYGWAVNAAKYALGRPPVPNPAIMTIPESDGE